MHNITFLIIALTRKKASLVNQLEFAVIENFLIKNKLIILKIEIKKNEVN